MTAISIERNTDKFEILPDDYKQAIRTSNYDEELAIITKKYKLHIDQSAVLEDLLARIIFGEVRPENIISEMTSKIHISNDVAVEIAKEIDQQLINPIKENLKTIQSEQSAVI